MISGAIVIGLSALTLSISAQQADTLTDSLPDPIYFETAAPGKTRFFFDDQYYLADKYCQYKQIERVTSYDFQNRVYEGPFKDFGPNGNVLLTGTYLHGIKTGPFKAYHASGKLKWEGAFENNSPVGLWRYYYPDGLPLQEIRYENGLPALVNFWDNRGRKEVSQGNGKYQFASRVSDFNEFGYEFIQSRGRIRDGVPHGFWNIDHLYAEGRKADAGFEQYKNGFFISGYDNFTGMDYDNNPKATFIPPEFFNRAEELISKNCNIDEHEGYNEYLRKKLESHFKRYNPGEIEPQEVVFSVRVNKTGEPEEVTAITTLPDQRAANILLAGLSSIPYWIPSYADGEYIDDVLTVSANVFPSLVSGYLEFYSIQIHREKGI